MKAGSLCCDVQSLSIFVHVVDILGFWKVNLDKLANCCYQAEVFVLQEFMHTNGRKRRPFREV
jgi:hypothetical protein